jgi:peptidyl-dipeptidase Dcp
MHCLTLASALALVPLTANPEEAVPSDVAENALIAEWTGPFGGVPAFDAMDLEALEPALEAGMARQRAELEAIAMDPEPASFENTIAAMERSGRDLSRVLTYWSIWSGSLSTPEFRERQRELAPRLSRFFSELTQNEPLFARIRAVRDSPELARRSPAEQRLVQLTYDQFARNGATLEGEGKQRYTEIDVRLAELHTRFSNNVLADEEGYTLFLKQEQLGGLPDSFVRAAAAAAAERDHEGEYAVTNTRSSMDHFLTYSDERALRE